MVVGGRARRATLNRRMLHRASGRKLRGRLGAGEADHPDGAVVTDGLFDPPRGEPDELLAGVAAKASRDALQMIEIDDECGA